MSENGCAKHPSFIPGCEDCRLYKAAAPLPVEPPPDSWMCINHGGLQRFKCCSVAAPVEPEKPATTRNVLASLDDAIAEYDRQAIEDKPRFAAANREIAADLRLVKAAWPSLIAASDARALVATLTAELAALPSSEGPPATRERCLNLSHSESCRCGSGHGADAKKYTEGSWPAHCEQRAFVDGAKWWEFTSSSGTMWASDRDKAEAEAVRRYGPPEPSTQSRPLLRSHEPVPDFNLWGIQTPLVPARDFVCNTKCGGTLELTKRVRAILRDFTRIR